MKKVLNYFLIPLLILNFISVIFLNSNLELTKNEKYIYYQNQKTKNYSKYYENSISSQQFIDDLESVPYDETYELQSNVDFSDSKNDDVTGISLNNVSINGNGYTLYNRDITEIFNTKKFEVSEENNGLGYYSFFQEINFCTIYNLNFDNFMLSFGLVTDSTFVNDNFYNLNYKNLTFNVESANISDDYEYQVEEINVNIATIGLIFQEFNADDYPVDLFNCCFENINFSNNTIILFDNSISTVVSVIGVIQITSSLLSPIQIDISNIYINNITFSNNKFISGEIGDDLSFEDENQQKYFSIFYNPFIGSSTNYFLNNVPGNFIVSFKQIIFNNINIYGNSNDFANYTFYALLPSIQTGITYIGRNIYGFNLNFDVQSQLDNNENIGIGNLSEDYYYPSDPTEDIYYDYKNTGIYQTDWTDDVYYQNIAVDYISFLDDESMVEWIYKNNYAEDDFNDLRGWWYCDKLSPDQDYSLIFANEPMMIYLSSDFYDQKEETINFSFRLIDGRFNDPLIKNDYYSNYDIDLINKSNNEVIWTGYTEYAPFYFEIPIDYNLIFENNLYFEISNDYHTWDKDIDFIKYLPEIYNVSNIVDNNNLKVSYDFTDPYNLINSIDILLYDDLNNEIESKTMDYNDLQNNYYLDSEEIYFTTKIDDPNNYYLKFEVNCNIHKFYDPNLTIELLDNNAIQYNENSDIEFRTESISPPDNNRSIDLWLIILIMIISLILLTIFIFLIYYFIKKNKKKNKLI